MLHTYKFYSTNLCKKKKQYKLLYKSNTCQKWFEAKNKKIIPIPVSKTNDNTLAHILSVFLYTCLATECNYTEHSILLHAFSFSDMETIWHKNSPDHHFSQLPSISVYAFTVIYSSKSLIWAVSVVLSILALMKLEE